jgi:hypothetical protein
VGAGVGVGAAVGGGGGGAAAVDVAGAGVGGGDIVLRTFTFVSALAFILASALALTVAVACTAVTVGLGAGALAAAGEPAVDAGAEGLAIADVLLTGVVRPAPAASPIPKNTATAATARTIFWSFFMGGPLTALRCQHDSAPHRHGRPAVM